MRCFSCDNLSLEPVCKECIKDFLTPEMIKKEVGNIEVISFFDYYFIWFGKDIVSFAFLSYDI